jgi:RNA polymerase sigma-B factor
MRLRHEGDPCAREALIARFLPLARSLARRYDRSTESLEDLVQVASLGLVKAVDRFDPTRGTAFASFAVPVILGELRRHFRVHGWAVHVPRGTQELALRIEYARREIGESRGRAPTVRELAEYLELDQEDVLAGMRAGQAYRALSLHATCPSPDEQVTQTYGDVLGAEDERYELVEDALVLGAALRHLTERERRVLGLRFHEQLTQTEIASRVGVSQMQVSRLLRGSLGRLREIAGADADESIPRTDALERIAGAGTGTDPPRR